MASGPVRTTSSLCLSGAGWQPHKRPLRRGVCDISTRRVERNWHNARAVLQTSDRTEAANDRLGVGVAPRLSRYLQGLTQPKKMGKDRISSQEIADDTNTNATQLPGDLSTLWKSAHRRVAGVKIILQYLEGLLAVPDDVQVDTSNPAVALLHALYFHLT